MIHGQNHVRIQELGCRLSADVLPEVRSVPEAAVTSRRVDSHPSSLLALETAAYTSAMHRLGPAALILFLTAPDLTLSASTSPGDPEVSRAADKGAESRPKLKIRLIAEPQVGFVPLTTMVTGTLTGVAPDDPNFCHPAVTWIKVSPGQLEENASRYHQDTACRHPESETQATTTFTRSFDLYRTGSYLLKLVVEGKDHRRVESAYVQVQVLRVQ